MTDCVMGSFELENPFLAGDLAGDYFVGLRHFYVVLEALGIWVGVVHDFIAALFLPLGATC